MFAWLEKNPFFLQFASLQLFAYAGIVEILPDFANRARPLEGTKPYTVLELAGKNIYMQNGCNTCHSQMIRPFKAETDRYGMYSLSGEFAYDRPHLWGSKERDLILCVWATIERLTGMKSHAKSSLSSARLDHASISFYLRKC